MPLNVSPSGQACGATITGVDLSGSLDEALVVDIRRAWMRHHVIAFPDQQLSDADLVRLTRCFGEVGDDPYFESIAPDNPVVALTRRADEVAPVFAEAWHSDWSFKAEPPIGTCLYSLTIPPVGGDTWFINQQQALAEMPADLRARIEGRRALHSARYAYAPEGTYGERETEADRSMKIRVDASARDVFPHPFILVHPESGAETLLGCPGYIIGIEGMSDAEAQPILRDLLAWQTREEFRYVHRWQEHMLVIWDNRSVLHRATGGYAGHARELHRTTIAADRRKFLAAA